MKFEGKSPNGINQTSVNSVSLFVSGSPILNASSESVSVVGNFTASAVQTNVIGVTSGSSLQIKGNTIISGSISASLFQGDGSGLFNINAASIGDLYRIKSGSAVAAISPNKGLEINTGVTVKDYLIVTGSGIFKGDISVAGKITTTELFATYISSSIIYASGSNKFGDASNDIQQITDRKSVV